MFRRTPRVSRATGLFKGTRTTRSQSRGLVNSSFARRLRVEALEDRRMLAVTVDFTGAYVMQNWTQSGILEGTTSQTPAIGSTDSPDFGYDVTLPGGGVSQRTGDFQLPSSPVTGSVTFDYVYTGNHRFFQAVAEFDTLISGAPTTVVNQTTSGDFTFSGSATIIARAGQSFGFRIGGRNNDSDSHIDGLLTITNFRAYDSIVVDSVSDTNDGNYSPGNLTLREAIDLANVIPGADTITFAESMSGQTILLGGSQLEITEALTIDATELGAPLSIDAQQLSRVLNFSALSGDLSLAGLSIVGGRTTADVDPGAGISFASSGALTLTQSTVIGNSTLGYFSGGGGIFANGAVTLTQSTVSGNSTLGYLSGGGGIFAYGEVMLTESTVSGNSTAGYQASGGGIFSGGGLTLTQSTVIGNSTAGDEARGGGIFANGAVTLTQSTVSGNSTSGAYAYGGGIYARGAVTLTQSTVSGNSISSSYAIAGGIYAGGAVTLTQSTVTDNRATGYSSAGGGVVQANANPLTIENSIVAGNIADIGPDLALDTGTPTTIRFSIIGDNHSSGLMPSPTPDANGNIIGTHGVPIDPKLAPLADNGGPTLPNGATILTHALLPGSPALDAGDPAVDFDEDEFDQRGAPFVRVFGSRVDIGAFEAELLVVNDAGGGSDGDIYNGITTLREAIGAANFMPGADTIVFAPSMSGQTILLGGFQLDITESLTVDATALTAPVTIDAQQQSRVMSFAATASDLTLTGLTMQNGRTTDDGNKGGGIQFFSSGTLALNQSTLSGNSTIGDFAYGGGIYSVYGSVMLNQTTLSGNSTAGSNSHGGGITTNSGAVTLNQSTLSGNSTGGSGARGGGIYTIAGVVTLNQSTLAGNSTEGSQADGGGIRTFSGAVTLNESTLSENTSTDGRGGGISTSAGFVTLNQSTLSGNSTINNFRNGGAIYNANGDVTLNQSTVSGNSTAGEGSRGGAIYATNGTVTLNHSTLSGNSTAGNNAHGGGIYSRASFSAVILNQSTVSGNSTTGDGARGGAIYAQSGGDVTLNHSTLSGNSTAGSNAHGGGIYSLSSFGEVTIHNSIVAGNTVAVGSVGPDLVADPGSAITVNYSLIGTGIMPTAGGNNISTDNPMLGPLANNGGPTQTHALLPGSPALDAGDPNGAASNAVHVYELNGSLADELGGPSLVVGGGFLLADGYQFGPNEGPQVSSAVTPDEYSIELVFSFDALGGYQKIIDFQDLADDTGLYSNGTNLDFYGGAVAENVLSPGVPVHLVVTRDAATDVLAVYANGVQVINFVDVNGIAEFTGISNVVRFFQDDNTTSGFEAASGFVDRIRIYDRNLSADEVAGLVFDQRGEGFDRVADGDGTPGARIDIGAYESQARPSADFDEDGDVDGRDFLAWQRGYSLVATATHGDGDADFDADVDGSDLASWQVSYGVTPVPLAAITATTEEITPVPEIAALEASEQAEIANSSITSLSGSLAVSRAREHASEVETAFEESYVEEVDRALEQLALSPSGVRSFGEMVARRGVKRLGVDIAGQLSSGTRICTLAQRRIT